MNQREFIDLVRRMREWQKAYFKSKGAAYPSSVTREALEMSKRLEGQVDKVLAEGITPDHAPAAEQTKQQGELWF